jgi:hypothetical protein
MFERTASRNDGAQTAKGAMTDQRATASDDEDETTLDAEGVTETEALREEVRQLRLVVRALGKRTRALEGVEKEANDRLLDVERFKDVAESELESTMQTVEEHTTSLSEMRIEMNGYHCKIDQLLHAADRRIRAACKRARTDPVGATVEAAIVSCEAARTEMLDQTLRVGRDLNLIITQNEAERKRRQEWSDRLMIQERLLAMHSREIKELQRAVRHQQMNHEALGTTLVAMVGKANEDAAEIKTLLTN